MEQPKKRTSMSVMEMGKLLGLGKTESYYLVRKNYFKVITVGTTMRVMILCQKQNTKKEKSGQQKP